MAFYPDVKKGDRFAPRADLENDVRHFFNSLNGFRGGAISGNSAGAKVKVYNAGTEVIPAESAVVFVSGDIISDAVPVLLYDGSSDIWGVTTQDIDVSAFGSAVISGPVQVTMASAGEGKYASPSPDGKSFTFSGSGAVVLGSSKVEESIKAVVVLGFGGGSVSLCKIVSVPSAGYGKGTAKIIAGYNSDGTPILSEEEIPVFIPRL